MLSRRCDVEYLSFYHTIVKGEFKHLHQFKKTMFNFTVISHIFFVLHIV
jgi:hypothetical protein